jgi:predicted nucleic acid-binding protein
MKWERGDASKTLLEILDDAGVLFLNQTKDTTRTGLRLAERYAIGGRDALVLACFLNPSIVEFKTFDRELIRLGKVEYGRNKLRIHAA